MKTLDADKQLISDLWLDQRDAHERIDERLGAGELSDAEAEKLRNFADNGYMTVSLGLDSEFSQNFDAELDRLWRERPVDLAAAPKSGGRVSFRDIDERHRSIGYRVADLHSHSQPALDLYLHPELFRMVELIFGQSARAFQSLYFQFGSEQGLHRDPMFVVTRPPSHLVAAWIALEDITPQSGPLIYAPGSHRMPWFEFDDDTVEFAQKASAPEKRQAWTKYRTRMIEEMNLEVRSFTAKRGDAFIWHGGLLHGGAPVEDERATRKSFVVHYSTADNYTSRRATMKMRAAEKDDEVWRGVSGVTDTLLVQGARTGMDNPLRYMKERPISAPSST